MPQIAAAVVEAGVARTALLDRPGVLAVRGVANIDHPGTGEQVRIACMPGRHHTIEHIDAAADRLDDVLRPAHTHEISGLGLRHMRHELLENLLTLRFRFPHCQAADRKAGKSNLLERRQRFQPQFGVYPPLNDAEQGSRRLIPVVLTKAPQRPAHR